MPGQFKKPPPLWKQREILKLRKNGISAAKIEKRLNVTNYDVRKYGGKSINKKLSAKDWAKLYPDLKDKLLSKDNSVVVKAMSSARNRRWLENPENKARAEESKVRHRTTDRYRETTEAYRPQAYENQKAFYARNPGLLAQHSSAYRKKVREATPPWIRNNPKYKKQIKDIYKAASTMKGGPWEVHHRVPIEAARSKGGDIIARGLNVPWNLEILPQRTNRWLGNNLSIVGSKGTGPADTGLLNENILPLWPEGSNLFSYIPQRPKYKKKKK